MKLKSLAFVVVLVGCSGVVLADDFAPPWYRGKPLSAEVEWEFTSWDGSTQIDPDAQSYVDDDNPNTFLYDKFTTHIDLDSASNWTWVEADGDGGLFANVDASFACNIINWVDEMPEKLLRIQITYIGDNAPTVRQVDGYGYYSPPTPPETYVTEPIGQVELETGQIYWDYEIYPNPEYEQIIIDVPDNTIIDEIYFDSVSPEPMTLMIMGIGALGLVRRRR